MPNTDSLPKNVLISASKGRNPKCHILPAIMLEELTGVELTAIPVAVAPLPWSFTMGSENTHKHKRHNRCNSDRKIDYIPRKVEELIRIFWVLYKQGCYKNYYE